MLKQILGAILLLGCIAGTLLSEGLLLPILLPVAMFGLILLGVPT